MTLQELLNIQTLIEQSKRDFVDKVHKLSDPDYDRDYEEDYEDIEEVFAAAEKEHGEKFAADLRNGVEKMHYSRHGWAGGRDKLASREKPRVRKDGKIFATSSRVLKNKIKFGQ